MLLNNFFYIDSSLVNANHITAGVHINTEHEILKGHFPGQAVVPGVCVIEMLKEILQDTFQKNYLLTESSQVKFLVMFTPPAYTSGHFEIDYKVSESNNLIVDALLKHGEIIFFKFKGLYTEK